MSVERESWASTPNPTTALQPPRMKTGVPWDMRSVESAAHYGRTDFGICTTTSYALDRVDYALRLALLTALPLALLTTNEATSWVFIAPSIAIVCGLAVPSPRIGNTIQTFCGLLTSVMIYSALGYAVVAIEPSRHWALWFALYAVLMLGFAFFTEGLLTKLCCFFFNILLITEYHGAFPNGESGYTYVGRFTIGVLIGAGVGVVAPFVPFPRTNRQDAASALKAAYTAISVCFEGCSASIWIDAQRTAVRRSVNMRHITTARSAVETHLADLNTAVASMAFEPHSADTQNRVRVRAAVANELRAGLDGLVSVASMLARQPALADDSQRMQLWGRAIAVDLDNANGHMEEICAKLGDIDRELTPDDFTSFEALRDAMRVAFERARELATSAVVEDGLPVSEQAPILFLGYFTVCHSRTLRTLTSIPYAAGWESRVKAADDGSQYVRDEDTYSHCAAAAVSTASAAGRSTTEAPSSPPLSPELPASPHRRLPSSPTTGRAAAAAEGAPTTTTSSQPAIMPYVGVRLPSPSLKVTPIEPMPLRIALYWPRAFMTSMLQVRALAAREPAAVTKFIEAAKLTFAMTVALAVITYFGAELPANGSAVMVFAKQSEAAATMHGAFDYMGSTITGSVYGFLAVTVAATEPQLIAALCVIVFLCSYVRAHPRFANPAFLITFFAVATMAPGVANEQALFNTVRQNVASMTWLALTHAVLRPTWPSEQAQSQIATACALLRQLLRDLLEAVETQNADDSQRLAMSVTKRHAAFTAAVGQLRATIAAAVAEPSLKRAAFPERAWHRAVDALAAVASLFFPVAWAVYFLHELPAHDHHDDAAASATGTGTAAANVCVPDLVLGEVRSRTGAAIAAVDDLLAAVTTSWADDAESSADGTGMLLQKLADASMRLRDVADAATATYTARYIESRVAWPFEIPALKAVVHLYDALPEVLNSAVEALIDARRGTLQVK